jgi:hypothetical protein
MEMGTVNTTWVPELLNLGCWIIVPSRLIEFGLLDNCSLPTD